MGCVQLYYIAPFSRVSTAVLQSQLEQSDLSSSYSVCVTVFCHPLLVTCAREHLQRDATYSYMQCHAQKLIPVLQFEISESGLCKSVLIEWCSECWFRLIFFTVYYKKITLGKHCHSPLYRQLEFKCKSQIDSPHSPKSKVGPWRSVSVLPQGSEQPGQFYCLARQICWQGLAYFSGQKSVVGSFFSVIGMLSEFDWGSCSAECILIISRKLTLRRVIW